MDADGSIVIRAELDDKQAQAELNRLTKKIDGLQEKLRRAQAERLPLVDQANELAAKLDEAKAKLDMMQASGASSNKIAAQQDQVRDLQSQWNAAMRQVESYDRTIAKTNRDIAWESEKAGGLSARLADVGDAGEDAGGRVSAAMEQVGKRIDKVGKRIAGLIKRVFFFSLITKALRGVRTWFSDIVKTSDEATAAIGRFKGALLTMAQPLIEVIIPALTKLVNALTKVILAIASFTSGLVGKTVQESAAAAESFNEEKNAIKGVGGAAKKASGQLAAFDQINKLAAEDAGGGASSEIQPTFDFDGMMAEDELNRILRIIEAIGAALLAWRIGKALGMGFKEILGLASLLYSTLEFIRNFLDAWNNGITLDNLKNLLLALAGMAAGAALAFGTLGAGIALIVGGLALLALGFKDLYENGLNLENMLTIIGGLMAAGLGISLLTGSFIPALIAAILSLILAFVYLFDEGELFTEGFRDIFDGLKKFFVSIFAGDVEGAIDGLKQAFEGLNKVGLSIIHSIQKAWQAFLDWLNKTLGPKWKAFFDGLGNIVSGVWNFIVSLLTGLIEFIVGVFTGDWKRAWDGLCEIGKGTVNALIQILEGFVNSAIAIINGIIGLINKIHLELDIPDWVPLIGGKHWTLAPNIREIGYLSLPRLAQGAVIPPNREFMAILGDQKSGTNIEAPLETIVAAFRQAVSEMGNSNNQKWELRVFLDSREIKSRLEVLSRVSGR